MRPTTQHDATPVQAKDVARWVSNDHGKTSQGTANPVRGADDFYRAPIHRPPAG